MNFFKMHEKKAVKYKVYIQFLNELYKSTIDKR